MLSDEMPGAPCQAPTADDKPGFSLMVYVDDVDAAFNKAIKAGCKEFAAPKDQFYGDRSGQVICPFNHRWTFSSHFENVTDAQMMERMQAMQKQGPPAAAAAAAPAAGASKKKKGGK